MPRLLTKKPDEIPDGYVGHIPLILSNQNSIQTDYHLSVYIKKEDIDLIKEKAKEILFNKQSDRFVPNNLEIICYYQCPSYTVRDQLLKDDLEIWFTGLPESITLSNGKMTFYLKSLVVRTISTTCKKGENICTANMVIKKFQVDFLESIKKGENNDTNYITADVSGSI